MENRQIIRNVLYNKLRYKDYIREDLIQVGELALREALVKFDPSKDYPLRIYIIWRVKRNIVRAIHRDTFYVAYSQSKPRFLYLDHRPEEEEDTLPDKKDPFDIVLQRLMARELDAVKRDRLTEKERKVLRLRFEEDLQLKEIAEITGTSFQSVWNTERRALKKLRKSYPYLKEYLE